MNYGFFGLVICFNRTTWFSRFTQITSFKNHFSPLCGKKHATSPILKISLYHLQFQFCPLASGLGFEARKNLSFVFFQKTQMKNSYPSYFEFKTMLCNMFHNFLGAILNCSKTMAKKYTIFLFAILLVHFIDIHPPKPIQFLLIPILDYLLFIYIIYSWKKYRKNCDKLTSSKNILWHCWRWCVVCLRCSIRNIYNFIR